MVNAGSLSLPSGQTGSGNFTVKDNAGLVIAVIPGQATLSMNILTIGTTNGTSLGVGYATNFTPTAITCSSLVAGGTNTVNVTGNASMPVTQQFSPGQYPLITYSAASGLTNTSFVMGTVPGGLKAYISNNLANSSIDLVITNITLGLTVTDATVYAISPTPASPTLNLSSLTLGTTNGAALGITMSGDSAAPVFASSLLVVHGTNIINVAGVGLTVGQFPLISYSTALGLTGADMVLGRLPSGVGGYLSNNVANLSVDLVITNVGVFLPLFWTGTSSSNWNQWVSANWLLNGAASIFIPGDAVIFNDAATGQTNINLATAVNPTSVVFSNSVLNYELQGGGAISGGASVTLSGNGQVTLATSNSHTGGTTLNSGTLNVNNASALGAAGNTFTIAGGTLDNTTGAGLTTLGYPQNWDGNFAFRGSASLGLGSGEASLGTNVSVDVNTNTLTVGGAITDEGNNYSLTKSGNGTLALSGGNTFSGGLYILAGTVQPSANSQALGGAGFGTVYLGDTAGTNSAALYGTGGGVGFANPIIVQQGSSGTVTLGNISGFFAGFSGAIILNRDLTVTTLAYTGGGTTFSGGISGVGGLNIVIGGGGNDALAYGLTLASYDSYTGGTTISNTTLILGSAGVIPNTTNIMLLTTTSYFDVSAQAGSFTLNSGQALGGSGLVHGGVNTASSSILAPGPSTGIGTLTLDSGLNLMGDVAVKLNKYLAQSNDMVVVQGNCANSGTGTLTVTNFGWGLIAGDKFTVFSQPLSGGDALTITGVPGVVWTNLLAVDGSIQVVSAPPIPATPPGFPLDAITELSGGNISLTVTGAIGTPYRLWASTNIALKPVASTWTLLQIGTINASPFTNVDLTATNYPRRFYLFSNP